jgi:hypothetical protein
LRGGFILALRSLPTITVSSLMIEAANGFE